MDTGVPSDFWLQEGPLGLLPAIVGTQSRVAKSLASPIKYPSPTYAAFPTILRFFLKAHVFSPLNVILMEHVQKCFLNRDFTT